VNSEVKLLNHGRHGKNINKWKKIYGRISTGEGNVVESTVARVRGKL